ncbi:MAG: NPXTG-anchored protein, partial [Ruminococcus sp.]|nr:NPXTG-anchored protein [Ruminococcus sp.]
PGDGEAASDNTENVETGAAENCALALMALSVAGIVVTKKKQN